jgi:hypothetical protein
MLRWREFEEATPGIAAVGKSLLYHPDRGEVGLLATVDTSGSPRLAPVCPVFTTQGIYLLAGVATPKRRHLDLDGRYALHAQVGADDQEFQIGGTCRRVEVRNEIAEVLAAITFESFAADDPLFELLIDRALWVSWDSAQGAVKRSWRIDQPAGS